jgi:hypothetical protein
MRGVMSRVSASVLDDSLAIRVRRTRETIKGRGVIESQPSAYWRLCSRSALFESRPTATTPIHPFTQAHAIASVEMLEEAERVFMLILTTVASLPLLAP